MWMFKSGVLLCRKHTEVYDLARQLGGNLRPPERERETGGFQPMYLLRQQSNTKQQRQIP